MERIDGDDQIFTGPATPAGFSLAVFGPHWPKFGRQQLARSGCALPSVPGKETWREISSLKAAQMAVSMKANSAQCRKLFMKSSWERRLWVAGQQGRHGG